MVVLYGKMGFMEIAFQNSCRLCSIRERKPDMFTAFLLQLSKAFFFQQRAVVDNSNIVSQQRNLRKNVTGNQNSFSSCVAKLPNKGAYFCNTDGIEAVDRLIQNQKFRIVHDCKGNRQPLLHAKRVLRKQLFILIRYGIPSFKLEKDVIDAEIDIIKAMGVEIKCGIEVGKDVTLDELRAQGYKAFYIAIGCQGGRKAGIPGEDAEGVMTAVDFLRTVGADESYPVTGKAVVVGGGNVAIDVARTAQRCGAESVAMFCLEPRDKMPASEEEIAEALEEDVTIDCGWGPKEILTENGRVTGIVFKRCVSVWDKDGKFAPAYDENDTKTVPCDRVFLSIGQSILWGDLLKGSKVELGRGNGAVADSLTYQTAEPDIFVGGDAYTGPKFAIDAIAAGREGAISIHRFVQPHSSLTIGRNRREFIALDKDNIKVEQYDNASRQIPGTRKDVDHKKSFRDAKLPFTEEQVKAETARCLGCGASVVDPNKCIGCGVCTTKCEFGAIKLHRERPECSNMIPSEKKLPYVLGNGAKQALKIKFSKKKEQ